MRSSNQWLINLSKDESLWAKDLATLPSMIHFEYTQLKSLAAQGQVYGVLLQLKDTYETILRIPVIMALVVIDSDPKYKNGSEYNDIMKAFLESPMSMGNWNNLARVIIKNNKKLNLPENLIKILERTRKLYNTEITAKVSDVVAWRNDTIGHGALKFEDDANYQEEVKSLLNLLKEYFDGEGKLSIKGLYDSIYFQCGVNKLVGDCYDKNADHDLILHIAGSVFKVSNYINDCDLKWYLFESFYCRKNLVKYSSYIDGKNNTVQNKYFSDLYEKHVLQGNKDAAVASDYISRAEDLILEYLNMPTDYVKPEKLVELLQEQMDTLGKGVISIFMERGTGKSAFSNQLSGLYHSKPLLKNSLSRCYHVSNSALRGVSDFTNSITNGFRHSFNPADDLWGSTEELPSLTLESENPAEDMADFLNFYHDKYRKDYTILVIDGIDETTEQSEYILKYIPSKDQLDEGVFVVLTTRFSDEETVQGKSKKYIEKATQLADGQLEIRRHDEINTELLKRYIEKHEKRIGIDNIDKDALIKKSDYRILYLRAYLAMKDQVALDSTNETKFIESYMNYLLSFYGINQKQKLKEIAVSIALFPSISIKKYQEYLNCQEITYEFVGLFNDLLPLLTVVHLDGEDCYEFADAAYEDFVIEAYPDVVRDVVNFFYQSYVKTFGTLGKFYWNLTIEHDVVFFITGFIAIWNIAKSDINFFDLFFKQTHVLDLFNRIYSNPWSEHGYGKVLMKEMIMCISEGLFLGLIKKPGTVCEKWAITVSSEINDSYNDIKNCFYHNCWYRKILRYLLNNYSCIGNIENWFWALANDVSLKIVEIVKALKREDKFVYYIFGTKEGMLIEAANDTRSDYRKAKKDKWAEMLLKDGFSKECEEILLNHLLKYYCVYRNDRDDLARSFLRIIREKGYRVLVEKRSVDNLENGNKLRAIFNRNVNDSVGILLDLKTPLGTLFPPDNIFIRGEKANLAFKLLDLFKINNVAKEDIKALFSAFYIRMCYEKGKNNLSDFLKKLIGATGYVDLVLKNDFGEGKEWHEELLRWIESTEEIVSVENKSIYPLLAQMMYFSVQYLEENHCEDEALSTLEKLVYEIDSKNVFSCLSDANSSVIYDMPTMVYCTENTLYFLKKLHKRGDERKVDKLLKDMEKTIFQIDKVFENDQDVQILCNFYKLRFLAAKRMTGYQNEFDDYLVNCLSVNEQKIYSFLENLSRNSDFKDLSYKVKLQFIFYWIAQIWETGEVFFDKLIHLLNSLDFGEDEILREILQDALEELKCYRDFFSWLNGKELLQTSDNISSLQNSPIHETIKLSLELLKHKKIDKLTITKKITVEERKKVEHLIKIELAPCSLMPTDYYSSSFFSSFTSKIRNLLC